jgi:hypothetical protein
MFVSTDRIFRKINILSKEIDVVRDRTLCQLVNGY